MHHDVKKKQQQQTNSNRNKTKSDWMRLFVYSSELRWMLLKSQPGQPAGPVSSV